MLQEVYRNLERRQIRVGLQALTPERLANFLFTEGMLFALCFAGGVSKSQAAGCREVGIGKVHWTDRRRVGLSFGEWGSLCMPFFPTGIKDHRSIRLLTHIKRMILMQITLSLCIVIKLTHQDSRKSVSVYDISPIVVQILVGDSVYWSIEVRFPQCYYRAINLFLR